jgi:hypothetical protein
VNGEDDQENAPRPAFQRCDWRRIHHSPLFWVGIVLCLGPSQSTYYPTIYRGNRALAEFPVAYSVIVPSNVPASTLAPSLKKISDSTPVAEAVTSMVAPSVSI